MCGNKLNSPALDAQNVRYFRIRIITRLLAIFIFMTLALQRLIIYFTKINIVEISDEYFWISLPLMLVLTLIIIAKYALYRRIGTRIFRYTILIDLAFTVIFMVDWVILLRRHLDQSESGDYRYSLASIVSLLGFSWRTLVQILMAQHWIFKIIPSLCAYIYVISFAVMHQPDFASYILLVGIFQVLYVVLIFYFDHKVHFRLLIGNLKQEQWLHLNEFILNNIPENIVIMDVNGTCKFINEHFKKMMTLRNRSVDPKQFFKKIKNLQRQVHLEDISAVKESTLVIHIFNFFSN